MLLFYGAISCMGDCFVEVILKINFCSLAICLLLISHKVDLVNVCLVFL